MKQLELADLFAARGRGKNLPSVFDRVDAAGPCWEWTGYVTPSGYGEVQIGRRRWPAHRLIYSVLVGPIPPELESDHLCRNRRCVNPDHIQPVPRAINWRRGATPSRLKSKQTHCLHGHPLSGDNLYLAPKTGFRTCRECSRRRLRERRARRRAAAL